MARLLTEGFETGDRGNLFTGTGGAIISTYARSGTYSVWMTNMTNTITVPSNNEYYFRSGMLFANPGATNTFSAFAYRNGTTTLVGCNAAYNKIFAYVWNTKVAEGTIFIQANTWYLIEVYAKIADSGGRLVIKVDGVIDVDYTGDTKPSTQTTIDNLYFNGPNGLSTYFDDIALNDTTGATDNSWPGDGHILGLSVNANGDVSQLSGSDGNSIDNYALVDDVPSDGDTTYVESAVVDQYDLYKVEAFPFSNVKIHRVWLASRARDTVAVGGLFQLGMKTEGSEFWGTSQSLITSYTIYTGTIYPLNPATALAWSISQLNSLQIGSKVK